MRHPTPPSPDNSFASPQLANQRTQDVFQSIVKGRKSWKTLRGGEVVWPPELEAALIEGLENYEPDDSRETRLLGRFPLRNRFISDWIFEKTGKRRTAKQVGSRLQQLRDTCGGRKLLNLLSPRRPIPRRACASLSPEMSQRSALSADESCSDRSSPAPTTPTSEVHSTLQTLLYRGLASSTESPPNSIVYIDLLPSSSASKGFSDYAIQSSNDDELMWIERGLNVVKISPHPRNISEIDPTVTFTSPNPINAVSVFSVYVNDDLVHSEEAPLKSHGQLTPDNTAHLYSTHLLPEYWSKMCQMPDVSRHTIVHRVVEDRAPTTSMPSPTGPKVLFSTMYRFKYCTQSLSVLPPEFQACSDFVTGPADKHSGLDFFDPVLSMSPGEGYYPDSKSHGFYELPSWNNGAH